MTRLKLFETGLTPEIAKKAEVELGETQEVRLKSLQRMKYLIKEEPDFSPCMDEAFLLSFLRAKKFNVDEAFKLFKKHYVFKAKRWGSITGFIPSDHKEIWKQEHGLILEYMDDNNTAVAMQHFGMFDLDKYSPEEYLSTALHCFLVGLKAEPSVIGGYIIIQDFAGLSFRNMMRLAKPSLIGIWIGMIQDCLPGRMKAMHIINAPEYLNVPIRFAKMLLSAKLQDRVYVHGDSLESLHKHVPADILPEEYGGKQGPWSECVKKYTSRHFSCDKYIEELNKYGYQGKTLQKLRKHSAQPIHSAK